MSGQKAYQEFLDFTRQMDKEDEMLKIAEICARAGQGLDPQSAAYDAAIRKALKESGKKLKTVPLEEVFGKPEGPEVPLEEVFESLKTEMPSADEAVSKGKPSSEVAKNVSDKPSVDKGDLKQKLRAKIAAKATNRMNKQ